jgi:hypothetical protein
MKSILFYSVSCFSVFCSSVYGCDKYEILKSVIQANEAAWKNEYELRKEEAQRAGIDPVVYHYLWYAKGCHSANSQLLDLINELEKINSN